MSILVGLAASNLGVIANEAPAYSVVLGFLLPMAVPLLLFIGYSRLASCYKVHWDTSVGFLARLR